MGINTQPENGFSLPVGCVVEEIIENAGVFERVYKCPDGQKHYIPESLLFSNDVE